MLGRRIVASMLLTTILLGLNAGCQRLRLPGYDRPEAERQPNAPGIVFEGVAATGRLPHETSYIHYAENPIIPGENIYAPSPVKAGDTWFVFYGGWSSPERHGRDDIYLAATNDPDLRAPYEHHDIVVHRGTYVHANDPSVVRLKDGRWVMALTVFDEHDWVAIVTSEDGIHWTPDEFEDTSHEVAIRGADFATIARPSLNYNPDQQRWEMYFDGRIEGGPAGQFLAVAPGPDVPSEFQFVERIGAWADADIRRLPDGIYIAAYRNMNEPSPWSIRFAGSEDGIDFQPFGIFLQPDAVNPYDDDAVSNPGWAIDEEGRVVAVLFGGSEHGLTYHQIGIAYPQFIAQPVTGIAHNFRQALHRNAQQVMVPEGIGVNRFVLWRNVHCPIARYEFPIPHYRGDRTRVRIPRTDCMPADAFVSPFEHTEDPEDYRPEDPTAGWIVTASSVHSEGMPPESVLARGGIWSSDAHDTADAVEWIQIELPQQRRIAGVTLTPRGRGYGFPRAFELQYSLDGESWMLIPGQDHWDYPNPGGSPQRFQFERPIAMRFFRIVATELSPDQFENHHFQLGRIELHRE